MRTLVLSLAVAASAWGCSKVEPEPLHLDGNVLTVDNRSDADWSNVEIWLNTYYRVTARSIRAKSRFQAPLDSFVAGFGQRFDFRRQQIKDLRLTGTLPDGRPFELKKQFEAGGLGGVAGSLAGRKSSWRG